MSAAAATCAVCGASAWQALPDVGRGVSVTTAGRIINEPLGKAHCRRCGLGQRVTTRLLAQTDFYEKRYTFYARPGAEQFDRVRYGGMAEWIRRAVPMAPRRILDAGCGRGWMMEALAPRFPAAVLSGIEPSEADSEHARQRGLDVIGARVGAEGIRVRPADLVYSTNVLEHTEAPADFLAGLRQLLAPDGVIAILCPDGSVPGAELMFADQNFSILPPHFERLAQAAGLQVVLWQPPPPGSILRDKQLVLLRHATAGAPRVEPAPVDVDVLCEKRRAYLDAWQRCDDWLMEACGAAATVYQFGTSTWAFLLAGYCRRYWARLDACMIDGGRGEFLGKPVLDAGRVDLTPGAVVVLGVDPDRHAEFASRFDGGAARIVSWRSLISR